MQNSRDNVGGIFRPRPGWMRHPLKVWPYTWASAGKFVVAFLVMTAVWTAAGFAVVEWFEPTTAGRVEADFNLWLEEERTDTWNTVARIASVPSDTFVKIGLMAGLAVVFPLVLRRWHDWAFLLGALVLEVSVYGLSSFLVGRPRPPVERLSHAPTESFPSGHMAAAVTFYVGLVMVVRWHTDNRRVRAAAWVVGALIPLAMAASRLYLGMHYISDIVAGAILGVVSLVVAVNIAQDGIEETVADTDEVVPEQVRSLEVADA